MRSCKSEALKNRLQTNPILHLTVEGVEREDFDPALTVPPLVVTSFIRPFFKLYSKLSLNLSDLCFRFKSDRPQLQISARRKQNSNFAQRTSQTEAASTDGRSCS